MNKYYLVDVDCAMRVRTVIKKRWYHRIIGDPFLTVDICEAHTENGACGVFEARNGKSHVIV